MAQGEGAEY